MNNVKKEYILEAIVGSKAHGLSTPTSDEDVRKVYIVQTSELLKVNVQRYDGVSSTDGKLDETNWEIGHFLSLATKSNPTILEIFKSPVKFESRTGKELKNLFPYVWNFNGVKNSFLGYSHDQRKRWFDDREALVRRNKYAVAHLRVLLQGIELLNNGDFSVYVKDFYLDNNLHIHLPDWAVEEMEQLDYEGEKAESWNRYLYEIKLGNIQKNNRNGGIFDTAEYLKEWFNKVAEKSYYKDKETDWDKVNEFLLMVRRKFW